MDDFVMPLPLPLDVASLTMGLVNIASPDGREGAIASSVEQALLTQSHLSVERFGDTVVARTDFGRDERVLLTGSLRTTSVGDDPMAYVEMGKLFGPGACGKGGLAVMLKVATVPAPERDVTFVFSAADDLDPALLVADRTVTVEPTDAQLQGEAPQRVYGPGDPALARTDGEYVPTAQLAECELVLRELIGTPGT